VRVLHVRLPDRLDEALRDRADSELTTVSAIGDRGTSGADRRSLEEILASEISIDWANALSNRA
jgi:hypothetical protein